MIEPATLTDSETTTPEAPHSWDPARRDLPAAKLDWLESLPFRQVRGVEVAVDPEHPRSGPLGPHPG